MDKPFVVLVSGTSSGFGRLISQTVAARGHAVFASMRSLAKDTGAAAELAEWAKAAGARLEVIEMDVTDDASVKAAVDRVVSRAGRLDVVVNNAGATTFGLLETFTLDR